MPNSLTFNELPFWFSFCRAPCCFLEFCIYISDFQAVTFYVLVVAPPGGCIAFLKLNTTRRDNIIK